MLLSYLVQLNEGQTPFIATWTMGDTSDCVCEVNEMDTHYQVLIRTPTQFIIPLLDLASITFTIGDVTKNVTKEGVVSVL